MRSLMELSQYYLPRFAIKGQAMANFIAELTFNEEGELSLNSSSVAKESPKVMRLTLMWDLYIDGSLNNRGCGVSLVLSSPKPRHLRIKYALRLSLKTSNNEPEYEVLLASLRLVQMVKVKLFHIYNDS